MKKVSCYFCGGNGREMHGFGGRCIACKGTGLMRVANCKMCTKDPAYPGAEYCGSDCYDEDQRKKIGY